MKYIFRPFGLYSIAAVFFINCLSFSSTFAQYFRNATGTAIVVPDTAGAGEYGAWSVIITVGADGIEVGGSIKIQFSNGWHTSQWPEGRLKVEQFTNPEANHYFAVKLSRSESMAKLSFDRKGVDGQHDRFGRSYIITISGHPLYRGDKVILTYSNTTAPITSETEYVAIAVDADGTGQYVPVKEFPPLRVLPRGPVQLRVIASSQAMPGSSCRITVVALDRFFNSTNQYNGTIHFTSDDSMALLPVDYRFSASDMGSRSFNVVFSSPGIHTIKVYDDLYLAPYGIKSNPVNVGGAFTSCSVYWGDLHSHSGNSKDGAGNAETAFQYAKNVSVLDFYALTDHGAGDVRRKGEWWEGLTPAEWKQNKELVKKYNDPGKFITFLACEWSGPPPFGHHNVFFRNLEGQPFGEDRYVTVQELWKLLRAGDAFTIPHHTGMVWPGGSSSYVDWRYSRNDTLRPSLEIYSLWGSSEYYGNEMSYEHYHRSRFKSHPGSNYARDGWANGQYLGVVGGSDDHNSHPGREYGGLTAVCASTLNRDSVFDAILQRHSYATTGGRILLNFTINGHIMGDRIKLKPGAFPKIHVKVAGTDIIDYVEIMKYDGRMWQTLFHNEPESSDVDISYIDNPFLGDALYYVRVKQRNIVHNRQVMAWSSPIWVSNESMPWWEKDITERKTK